ncbi:MAG: hypothetical protein ACXVCS_14075 [Bdellovibrionota bacterium]
MITKKPALALSLVLLAACASEPMTRSTSSLNLPKVVNHGPPPSWEQNEYVCEVTDELTYDDSGDTATGDYWVASYRKIMTFSGEGTNQSPKVAVGYHGDPEHLLMSLDEAIEVLKTDAECAGHGGKREFFGL